MDQLSAAARKIIDLYTEAAAKQEWQHGFIPFPTYSITLGLSPEEFQAARSQLVEWGYVFEKAVPARADDIYAIRATGIRLASRPDIWRTFFDPEGAAGLAR